MFRKIYNSLLLYFIIRNVLNNFAFGISPTMVYIKSYEICFLLLTKPLVSLRFVLCLWPNPLAQKFIQQCLFFLSSLTISHQSSHYTGSSAFVLVVSSWSHWKMIQVLLHAVMNWSGYVRTDLWLWEKESISLRKNQKYWDANFSRYNVDERETHFYSYYTTRS